MAAQRRQIKACNRGFYAKSLSAETHRLCVDEHERLAAALRRTASESVTRMRDALTPCGNVRHFRGEAAAEIGPAQH
jgi:hypothetical protein